MNNDDKEMLSCALEGFFDDEKDRAAARCAIYDALEMVDFERIASVMEFLDWRWMGNDRPPAAMEIRRHALGCIASCLDTMAKNGEDCCRCASGGIETRCEMKGGEFCVNVWFVLEEGTGEFVYGKEEWPREFIYGKEECPR